VVSDGKCIVVGQIVHLKTWSDKYGRKST